MYNKTFDLKDNISSIIVEILKKKKIKYKIAIPS